VRRVAIAAILAAAVGGAAVPAAAESPPTASFGAFTLDPGNQACIPGTDPSVGATRFCDPINVIFPGQSLDAVVARLQAAGWSNGSGTEQWLAVGTSTLLPVGWQLGWPDGSDPTQRYHVRLWQVAPNLTVGNVHHEHGTPHQIDMPWDQAEAFLAGPLCSWWCRHLPLPEQSMVQGGDLWRGWQNDGIATVIPAQAPTTPPSQPPLAQPRRHRHRRPTHA
jgi:hypothetical protein